jgi:hypothetical protein
MAVGIQGAAGDEVRGVTFPRQRGYDGAAVWSTQLVIADLLDAGRSPATYLSQKTLPAGYGFDMEAVDRYLDGLVGKSDMTPVQDGTSTNPWTGRLPTTLRRGATPGRYLGPDDWVLGNARSSQFASECENEWFQIPSLPGTHLKAALSLRTSIKWTYQWPVSAREIQSVVEPTTLATVRLTAHNKAVLTVTESGEAFQILGRPGEVVAKASGELILQRTGESGKKSHPLLRHQGRQPFTAIYLPDRRWFRFPVRGTRRGDAVMTAVDQSETEVMWFRLAGAKGVDVVVAPERRVTTEVLCVIAIASPLIWYYFVGLPQTPNSEVIRASQAMP